MTLTAENLHSTVNKKQSTQTLVQYAQSFSAAQSNGTMSRKMVPRSRNSHSVTRSKLSCTWKLHEGKIIFLSKAWFERVGIHQRCSCETTELQAREQALYLKTHKLRNSPQSNVRQEDRLKTLTLQIENEVDQTDETSDHVEEIPQYESESDDGDDGSSLTTHLFTLIRYQMLRLF